MRIAIVDESATRAAVIREGLATYGDCELFVLTERRGLLALTFSEFRDVTKRDVICLRYGFEKIRI